MRLREHGVELDRALEARSQLESAAAYLELHIEQGPVLESMDLPLGAVLGTFGVERHRITWHGQAAHAGSTPMDQRRDALAGAAKLALELREIAKRTGDGAVLTSGGVVCKPGIVTSVVETAEQLLDMRHLDAAKLASMWEQVREACERFAQEEKIEVEYERIWEIQPILFDETLIGFADEAIREVAGTSHRLPSGPLHDAAEVSRAGVPTVMLFVQSLRGLSHTKLEDTKPEHLELAVQALDRLATKTIAWAATGHLPRAAIRARMPLPATTFGGPMLSFGVTVLPDPPYQRLIELMKLAEAQGFEYAWTYDSHVLWQESMPVMALAADQTSKIKLGHMVTNPATRDPTVLASAYATLHDISERPDDHGRRPRRLGRALRRPPADEGRRVRGSAADDQAVHERQGGDAGTRRSCS